MAKNLNDSDVDLRDDPMDPLSERDQLAALVLKRLDERDDVTHRRFENGRLSPLEVARVAAEVMLEERPSIEQLARNLIFASDAERLAAWGALEEGLERAMK